MILFFLFQIATAQIPDWYFHYHSCFHQFQNEDVVATPKGVFVFFNNTPYFVPHSKGNFHIRDSKQNFYVSLSQPIKISKKPIPHAVPLNSKPEYSPDLQNAMIDFFEKNISGLQIKYIDRSGYELDDEKKQAIKHNSDIKAQLETCDKEIRQTPKPPPLLLDHLKNKIQECNVPMPGGLPGFGRNRAR